MQCAFCRGSISRWEPTDQPSAEHRRLHPRCPFVLGRDVGNIANPSDTTTDSRPITNHLIAETSAVQNEAVVGSYSGPLEQLKYPQYSQLSDRINSFTGRTLPQGQSANRLAEAGWFHVGPGDKVRCFQCGGNLRDWEPGDDAWEEHRRWYKDCPHLKTQPLPAKPRIQATTSEAVRYRIEPREIKARLDTPSVRTILSLGYELSVVRQVIETQLMNTGDDFPNAEAILEAIFALEDPIPSLPSSSSTSSMYTSDHQSNTDAATSDATSSQRLSSPEGSFSLSSESASSNPLASSSASQSVTPQSLSSTKPNSAKPMNKMQSLVANISRKVSDSSAAASANANQPQANSEDHSKSKGRRKKIKKKNSPAHGTNTEETQQRAGVPSQLSPNKNATKQEEINDIETLEYLEENRRLLDARTCKVCMDAEVNTVFLPCGHLVCCDRCAPLLRDCPICRTYVRGTVKTFLS